MDYFNCQRRKQQKSVVMGMKTWNRVVSRSDGK